MWPFSPSLPKGVTKLSTGSYEIDPSVAYPIWLDMLELGSDRYGMEVVKKCITKKIQETVDGGFTIIVKYSPNWNYDTASNHEAINKAANDAIIHWKKLKKNKLV